MKLHLTWHLETSPVNLAHWESLAANWPGRVKLLHTDKNALAGRITASVSILEQDRENPRCLVQSRLVIPNLLTSKTTEVNQAGLSAENSATVNLGSLSLRNCELNPTPANHPQRRLSDIQWQHRNDEPTVTSFYPGQQNCIRHLHETCNAETFNFTSHTATSICTVMFTSHVKLGAINFKGQHNSTLVRYRFYTGQALPLDLSRFGRLDHHSPMVPRPLARWTRDVRKQSCQTSGKMSCALSAKCLGNGRAVAGKPLASVRQDDSQDNLPADTPCPRNEPVASRESTCQTTCLGKLPSPLRPAARRTVRFASPLPPLGSLGESTSQIPFERR